MVVPPTDPAFGVILTSLGVMATPASKIKCPSGFPSAKDSFIPVILVLASLRSVKVKTASEAVDDFAVCATPSTVKIEFEVALGRDEPETTSSQVLVGTSKLVVAAVMVGRAAVNVKLPHTLAAQVASSEALRNTTTVPEVPAVLVMVSSRLQVICVAEVVKTKPRVEPTPPLYEICTGLSVETVPKLVPVMVSTVPP